MAIQTKIILTKSETDTEHLLTPNVDWEQPLFVTGEYTSTKIKFVGNNDERLWIEHTNELEGVLLSPNDSFQLIKNDEGYVPGSFIFKWYTNEKTFEGHFQVKAHSLDDDVIHGMYEALEERAYDVTRNKHALAILQGTDSKQDEHQHLLLLLTTHYEELMRYLINIEHHPQEAITNEYHRTSKSIRPTPKSLRWQVTKGRTGHQYFEPKKQVSYNTTENQYIKHILLVLLQRMDRIRQIFHEGTGQKRRLKQDLVVEIKELHMTRVSLGSGNNFTTLVYDLDNRLKFKNKALRQLRIEISQDENRHKPVYSLYAKISQLLNEPWLKSVSQKYRIELPKQVFHLNHYRSLALFYQRFMVQEEKLYRYPHHQTSLMFEYFSLFLVQEILESQGFKCFGFQNDLPFNERILFRHDSGEHLYLSYDRFIGDLTLVRRRKEEQLISVVGGSRKPDILLELYDKEGNFKQVFIIEVKYRRLKNIYQGDVNTDVINQLNTYSTFKYYRPDKPLSLDADVRKIVVLYPEHESSHHFHEPVLGYEFIPIVPAGFSLKEASFIPLIRSMEEFLK